VVSAGAAYVPPLATPCPPVVTVATFEVEVLSDAR
jgi:hypothetical protein